jgi:hypothetical protein
MNGILGFNFVQNCSENKLETWKSIFILHWYGFQDFIYHCRLVEEADLEVTKDLFGKNQLCFVMIFGN